jgi:outer membrane receptor for ferrienterochelin and colicins
VSRPQNIGVATTQGLELEAKFRLTELVTEAPALDIRANASLFRSRVASVPGPDNRLDQQPAGTANLGADYRLPGWPLTVGANLNWTPGYTTRLSENQWLIQSRKRVVDAYALWTLSPQWRLRLSANNLGPEDAVSTSAVAQETAVTRAETALNWRLQLEIKL